MTCHHLHGTLTAQACATLAAELCEQCDEESGDTHNKEDTVEAKLSRVAQSLQRRMLGRIISRIRWAQQWVRTKKEEDGGRHTVAHQRRMYRVNELLLPCVYALMQIQGGTRHFERIARWHDRQGRVGGPTHSVAILVVRTVCA